LDKKLIELGVAGEQVVVAKGRYILNLMGSPLKLGIGLGLVDIGNSVDGIGANGAGIEMKDFDMIDQLHQ
jgi:hypothetical protein